MDKRGKVIKITEHLRRKNKETRKKFKKRLTEKRKEVKE